MALPGSGAEADSGPPNGSLLGVLEAASHAQWLPSSQSDLIIFRV